MKIKSFDRATCRNLSQDIVAALQQVAKQHGITISAAGGNFSDEEFKMKFVAHVEQVKSSSVVVNGATMSAEQAAFYKVAKRFGFLAEDFNKDFHSPRSGRSLTIKGIKVTSKQAWIITEGVKGGRWRLHAEDVLSALGR